MLLQSDKSYEVVGNKLRKKKSTGDHEERVLTKGNSRPDQQTYPSDKKAEQLKTIAQECFGIFRSTTCIRKNSHLNHISVIYNQPQPYQLRLMRQLILPRNDSALYSCKFKGGNPASLPLILVKPWCKPLWEWTQDVTGWKAGAIEIRPANRFIHLLGNNIPCKASCPMISMTPMAWPLTRPRIILAHHGANMIPARRPSRQLKVKRNEITLEEMLWCDLSHLHSILSHQFLATHSLFSFKYYF